MPNPEYPSSSSENAISPRQLYRVTGLPRREAKRLEREILREFPEHGLVHRQIKYGVYTTLGAFGVVLFTHSVLSDAPSSTPHESSFSPVSVTKTVTDLALGDTGCIPDSAVLNFTGDYQVQRDTPVTSIEQTYDGSSQITRAQPYGYTVITTKEIPQATDVPPGETIYVSVTKANTNQCGIQSSEYAGS